LPLRVDRYHARMTATVEKWVLTLMLVAGAFLGVAAATDQDWLRALLWSLVVAVVTGALLRRRSKGSSGTSDKD
jgi:uncharacterized membrane protein YfcA